MVKLNFVQYYIVITFIKIYDNCINLKKIVNIFFSFFLTLNMCLIYLFFLILLEL